MTRAELAAFSRLRAVTDTLEETFRQQVLRALQQLQAGARLARIERVLVGRDPLALIDLVNTLPQHLRPSLRTLQLAYDQGLKAGTSALASQGVAGFRLDQTNPFAVQEARSHAARFVTAVTDETRQAVRTVVARAFSQGIPPRQAAQLIRPLIGLTSRQAQMVTREYTGAVAGGASPAAARLTANAVAQRLLRHRALVIARTEILGASNAGEVAAWRQAQQLGYLGPADKVWIVTPDDRLCPRCKVMDGRVAALQEPFRTALGQKVDAPPLHPNCRCTVGLEPARGRRQRTPVTPLRRRRPPSVPPAVAPPKPPPAPRFVEEPRPGWKRTGREPGDPAPPFPVQVVETKAVPAAPLPTEASLPKTPAEAFGPITPAKKPKYTTPEEKAAHLAKRKAWRDKRKAAKQAVQLPPPHPSWPIDNRVPRALGRNYPDTIERQHGGWARALSLQERDAIRAYTGSEYGSINGVLRGKIPAELDSFEIKEARAQADHIQRALMRGSNPPELVWRGSANAGAREFADKLSAGDVVALKGFQSTSIDPHFARRWSSGGVVFEIKPKRGAYVRTISSHKQEYEYLLPHDQQYRVHGRTIIKMQGATPGYTEEVTVIQLEML